MNVRGTNRAGCIGLGIPSIGAIIKLFEMGKITLGTGAKILRISRLDFLDLLSEYQVSPFSGYTSEELDEDIKNP